MRLASGIAAPALRSSVTWQLATAMLVLLCSRWTTVAEGAVRATDTGPATGAGAVAVQSIPEGDDLYRDPRGGGTQRFSQEGIEVVMKVRPLRGRGSPKQGQPMRIEFTVTDAAGSPIAGEKPMAWMHRADTNATTAQKIRSFSSGSAARRADVDLNRFFILALNQDATISVLDPLFGFGGSKLLALVQLGVSGEDWALSPDQRSLYVTLPTTNRVAVVNTSTWTVDRLVEVGPGPRKLLLQRDGTRLWIACEGAGGTGGSPGTVVAMDTKTFEVRERLATGHGRCELVLSDDDRYLCSANCRSGLVQVVPTRDGSVPLRRQVAPGRIGVTHSDRAKAFYVKSENEGHVLMLGGRDYAASNSAALGAGVTSVAFAPGRRHGLFVDPGSDELCVLDTSDNRVVQRAAGFHNVDGIFFSERNAYLRSPDTEVLKCVAMDQVGVEGQVIPVTEIPAGYAPFGAGAPPAAAAAIARVPAPGAVVVANPGDKAIHYYQEGMAAPSGSFKNYDRQPRAVIAVDKSLRETSRGVYAVDVTPGLGGQMDVLLLMRVPPVQAAFTLEVAEDEGLKRRLPGRKVVLAGAPGADEVSIPGRQIDLRLRIASVASNVPAPSDVRDLQVVVHTPANWMSRGIATPVGGGEYQYGFVPPQGGVYYISAQSGSLGLRFNDSDQMLVVVGQGSSGEQLPREPGPSQVRKAR